MNLWSGLRRDATYIFEVGGYVNTSQSPMFLMGFGDFMLSCLLLKAISMRLSQLALQISVI
jgi:hypothetical protein